MAYNNLHSTTVHAVIWLQHRSWLKKTEMLLFAERESHLLYTCNRQSFDERSVTRRFAARRRETPSGAA
jgi:hypothetical protein